MPDHRIIQDYITAARSGEQAAWNVVYQHHYPALYVTALRICNSVPTAKDMVQEAFITAYLKLPQLKDVSAFGGWMKKILVHTCYRALRRQQHGKPQIPVEPDSWWEDEFSRKLDQLATQSDVHAILAHLPETLRATIMLRYFSSFSSYEEIATILAVPVGTVRSRLNQAKTKLAEKWHQDQETDPHIFEQGEEWNHFYHNTFSALHYHDDHKTRLMRHLQKDVQIIRAGDRPKTGSCLFEKMIEDDRKHGSWLAPTVVMTSGNISIVETAHFNSPEHPRHCPPSAVVVLYRHERKVNKMNFHISSV